MAHLRVDGSDLVVALNRMEELGAMHGTIRVPVANVTSVDVSDALWDELLGMRMPGTGIPGVIALGSWRYSGGKDFVAVYGRRGVVITLSGAEWNRLILSSRNPHRLSRHVGAYR